MDFNVPSDWILINNDEIENLGNINNDNINCISAYAINRNGYLSIVCFFDYSEYSNEYLSDFDNSLSKSNDTENEGIYTLKNIFHGFLKDYNKIVYVNIYKISIQENENVYTVQIFVEQNNGLICIQYTLNILDEANPLKSALNLDFVKEGINLVL